MAIQLLHWSPSQLEEWIEADDNMKSIYYASSIIKSENDKKRAKDMERKAKKKK